MENETENFETESTKVSVENKKLEIFLQSNTLHQNFNIKIKDGINPSFFNIQLRHP